MLRPRRPAAALALAAAVAVAGCAGDGRSGQEASPGSPAGPAAEAQAGLAVVERVVDGDTLVVRVAGRRERVRMIGIDTPESVKPGSGQECFGREAAARTRTLLPERTTVRLVRDAEARDRYGRLLAYVYRHDDDLFVNVALARDGFATPYTRPPNVAHADQIVAAAAEAREAGRGLWASCADELG